GPFSELKCFKRSAFSALNPWLVALADDIAASQGRPIGAIGMCLTGIQPLAMLRSPAVVAPVLCQPTVPIGHDATRMRDVGLPPSDFDFALARVHTTPLKVQLVRYTGDTISSPARAERLYELFTPHIDYVRVEGHEHSSLVHHPDTTARAAVVA